MKRPLLAGPALTRAAPRVFFTLCAPVCLALTVAATGVVTDSFFRVQEK